jgi:predicted Zn-dependent peptidase
MVLSDKIIPVEEVLERIEAVTQGDIQNVARDLLRKEKLSLAAVGPFEEEDEMMGVIDSSML